jgi:hypothetical protein
MQLTDTTYLYVAYRNESLASINTTTGMETKSNFGGSVLRLKENTTNLYVLDDTLERFYTGAGPMVFSSYLYSANLCSNMWLLDGDRLVDKCGKAVDTSLSPAEGTFAGFLSGLTGKLSWLDDAGGQGMLASVGETSSNEDGLLYLHERTYLAMAGKLTLPKFPSPATVASTGRFAFWSRARSSVYVILKAAPSGGVLNDSAMLIVAPSNTPSCSVTLPASPVNFAAGGAISNVVVTANNDCVWKVSTDAPWISINTGLLGIGSGNVGYTVYPNQSNVSRTGRITVDGQVFTITQTGGPVLSTPSAIYLHYTWGGAIPDPVEVDVTASGGQPIAGLTLIPGGPDCSWLSLTLTSTSTPSRLRVAVINQLKAPGTTSCSFMLRGSMGSPAVTISTQPIAFLTAEPMPFLASAVTVGSMRYLEFESHTPFGYFGYLSNTIIYHNDLGYLSLIDANDGGGIYLYDFRTAHWWYSSRSAFPYLYDFTLNLWIYYFPVAGQQGKYTSNPRYFANMSTSQIFTM